MIVKAIQCPQCRDQVYSRAHHDFRSCSCGTVSIDGGFEYQRILWRCDEPPQPFPIDIGEVTKLMLYNDWSHGRQRYGIIKEKSNRCCPDGV